jgi:glyoxylase-like metal-dependent hydrolase (beta-lactamase superfamily II)
VIGTPGHCDDHIVLYDPKEKVLLAGDAFMGSYFATPNPDVDSHKWLMSLERLMELDIEIMVEGHGHIHTLRADVPDFPGVEVGASAGHIPPRYNVDHNRIYLGKGEVTWRRTVAAIRGWQMFTIPWMHFYWPSAPIQVGIEVAVSAHGLGFHPLKRLSHRLRRR